MFFKIKWIYHKLYISQNIYKKKITIIDTNTNKDMKSGNKIDKDNQKNSKWDIFNHPELLIIIRQ